MAYNLDNTILGSGITTRVMERRILQERSRSQLQIESQEQEDKDFSTDIIPVRTDSNLANNYRVYSFLQGTAIPNSVIKKKSIKSETEMIQEKENNSSYHVAPSVKRILDKVLQERNRKGPPIEGDVPMPHDTINDLNSERKNEEIELNDVWGEGKENPRLSFRKREVTTHSDDTVIDSALLSTLMAVGKELLSEEIGSPTRRVSYLSQMMKRRNEQIPELPEPSDESTCDEKPGSASNSNTYSLSQKSSEINKLFITDNEVPITPTYKSKTTPDSDIKNKKLRKKTFSKRKVISAVINMANEKENRSVKRMKDMRKSRKFTKSKKTIPSNTMKLTVRCQQQNPTNQSVRKSNITKRIRSDVTVSCFKIVPAKRSQSDRLRLTSMPLDRRPVHVGHIPVPINRTNKPNMDSDHKESMLSRVHKKAKRIVNQSAATKQIKPARNDKLKHLYTIPAVRIKKCTSTYRKSR